MPTGSFVFNTIKSTKWFSVKLAINISVCFVKLHLNYKKLFNFLKFVNIIKLYKKFIIIYNRVHHSLGT